MRRVIAALVVLAMAVAVVLLWPRSNIGDGNDTQAVGSSTSTSSTSPISTTTVPATTTTLDDTRVVETVAEAEAILRELWFGWFEGIYLQDEDRIREVVGNPEQVQTAVDLFGSMSFDAPPTRETIEVRDTEILRSDEECLAVWAEASGSFRSGSISGVHVFRPSSMGWLLINTWPNPQDLWEADCEAVL